MMKQTKPGAAKASSLPKAIPLDLSSVPTRAPPEQPPPNAPTRIFGLQEAPCYYPTPEEFMEPIKFIESIRPEAEKAGICKIIPPDGWRPTFALDSEVFHFKTRIQKLNSMEGETRTNLNYLDQLYKFHRQQGHPVHKIPQLDKRPIDLFRLRKEVASRGGYQKVTTGKKWAEIGRELDYTRKQCTSLSNALKTAYLKVILPYDIYLSKQGKLAPENHTQDIKRELPEDTHTNGSVDTSRDSAATTTNTTATNNNVPETRKSKRIKKDPVSYAGDLAYSTIDSEPSSPSNSDRMSSEPLSSKKDDDGQDDPDICQVCHADSDLDKMLICDGCELGYHTFCLTPPLQHIPKTDWYCAKCLVAGDDFGFEEGEEYSLSTFQQKCNDFKRNWFEKFGYTDGRVPEDAVEREFWRLVENAYETVEVEYGADLHSTQHGSGFPSLERNPLDKYSAHPANLNNIPVLPESLLSHIKTDISGMMVPWLYVGMCFSTFCWHNEDHYTYSINYMHWGETKTWYGVPASDALKFEDTMKAAVPELFEQQPDLLFQLVTMLSPERLVANNVKVVALDQRPGQFVVTFPQAYHAGFNHGFNFAEAVNFAPPDWCPFGLECVQRYKEHRKQPVFSHDELIMTTAIDDTSIATADWLQDELKNLVNREMSDRREILKKAPGIRIVTEELDRPEEEVQCMHCNSFIYLSQVGCRCTTKVACRDHIDDLCQCAISERFLRLRYSEEQLRDISQRVTETAGIPGAWIEKYQKTLLETRVPSLKLLRSLLTEAERIPFPIQEAGRLRRFVNTANEWVEAASKVLVRKHHQGRRVMERAQGSNGKRLEDLQEMLRQVERMRFDCLEIKQLEDSIESIQDFQLDARNALNKPEHDLAECRELYDLGVNMNIVMDEVDQLEAIVTDLTWMERVSAKGVLQEDYLLICSLVEDAEKNGVSPSNPLLIDLIKKQDAGQRWEEKAQDVLSKNPVDLDELHAVIEAGRDFPVPRNVLSKAEQLHTKAVDWQRTIEQMVKKSGEPIYTDRPLISDLKRALKAVDSMPIMIEHKEMFEEEVRKFEDWIGSLQALLLPSLTKRPAAQELEEALEDLKQNVEACTADEKPTALAALVNGPHGVDTTGSFKKHTAGMTNGVRVPTQDGSATADAVIETQATSATDSQMDEPDRTSTRNMDIEPSAPISEEMLVVAPVAIKERQEPSGQDMASEFDRDDKIYCLCRTSESGMMVECDECHEWYHGPCIRMTKREASSKSNYICPICNLSLVIKRDFPRPELKDLAAISQTSQSLRFFTPEAPLLASVVAMATGFHQRVSKFLEQDLITEKDVPEVKAYLRKIEGLEVGLPKERDVLRTHVLRLCPSSIPVPTVMLSTYPSAPPVSEVASTCICAQHVGETGNLQPPTNEIMIQCGICTDWMHLPCVGIDLDQVQRLSKFICPVCCLVRRKAYMLGQVRYPEEAQVRASGRTQANKDAADAKKRARKLSKDSNEATTGTPLAVVPGSSPGAAVAVEEKKKRAYKKREPSENGEKGKPKRRKSSAGQSTDSSSTISQGSGTPTTLPSFSEGFLLPHDRSLTTQQQQQQQHLLEHQHQHQRRPSHTLPPYSAPHTLPPHSQHPQHPAAHQSAPPLSSPQHLGHQHQQRRYTPPQTTTSFRHYQPSPPSRDHAQLSPAQGHPLPPPSTHARAHSHSRSPVLPATHARTHSHSRSPVLPAAHAHAHHQPHSHPYAHSSGSHYSSHAYSHSHSHSHSHPRSPTLHERSGQQHLYGTQPYGPIQHGNYPPPPPSSHHHHQQHPHHTQQSPPPPQHRTHAARTMHDRLDAPPPMRTEHHEYHPHYSQHHPQHHPHHHHQHHSQHRPSSPPPPIHASARPYGGYSGSSSVNPTGGPSSLTKGHPIQALSQGLRTVAIGPPSSPRAGYSQLETGSGGETETDDEESSAAKVATAL
ncbi:hypothetical protein BGZ99_005323 [Dissophora globulifera]|uniref:[histone H3]-trimethyl-L-lysine(4) demethylase n=1 Tax=Dissophora globulifera TaxID=979702 RepID=A0A9P6RHE5_9FUNG|nr:hypothetical protein BGZ99_005323 [Dissophora globulifera]